MGPTRTRSQTLLVKPKEPKRTQRWVFQRFQPPASTRKTRKHIQSTLFLVGGFSQNPSQKYATVKMGSSYFPYDSGWTRVVHPGMDELGVVIKLSILIISFLPSLHHESFGTPLCWWHIFQCLPRTCRWHSQRHSSVFAFHHPGDDDSLYVRCRMDPGGKEMCRIFSRARC